MDKWRCTSPDITEAPSLSTAAVQRKLEAIKIRQNAKDNDSCETIAGNSVKETAVVASSAPEEVKKKRGRPRKNPLPPPPSESKISEEDSKLQKSKIKNRQPKVVISRLKELEKKEVVVAEEDNVETMTAAEDDENSTSAESMVANSIKSEVQVNLPDKNSESLDNTGVSSIFNVKIEPNFGPGYIPGLDLVNYSTEVEKPPTDFSEVISNSKKNILSNKEKKVENPEVEEKPNEDDSDNKIRRSSRIKTLEEQRGSRGRRREVVFSTSDLMTTSNKSSMITNDDDSNSNESSSMHGSSFSSPTRDGNQSSISSSVSSLSNPANQFTGILSASFSSSSGSLKPLKVKSRWRYSLDAENMKSESGNGNSLDFQMSLTNSSDNLSADSSSGNSVAQNSNNLEAYLKERNLIRRPGHIIHEASDIELVDKLKKFEGIHENLFRTEIKISKEGRGMICDCFLSKEEIMRGEIGCNEDCLNRLLMVECGSRCPTGDRCTNKKFQRKEYCLLEVFQTDKKGHGLRTLQPLPQGGFVIEYVGEVLDARAFKHRTKEYAKGKQEHFYFMALKSDAIIDATLRGNCSRFINHSCEPNCETQKWTVNGELRIGFFSIRDLQAGEEITFDYQFQRYGKKAQRCFCMTPSCRGWIGGEEEDENREPSEPAEIEVENQIEVEQEPNREKLKEKPKIERKKRKEVQLEDMAYEEELGTLEKSGLKNRHHTLTLSRLMVRAEDWDIKERLLNILVNGDTPCRRLFLDYHGLRLIWSWMVDLPLPTQGSEIQLIRNDHYHLLFLKALASLPIPNKSLLQDSKVLALMEKWSQSPPSSIIPPSKISNSEATSKIAKVFEAKTVEGSENEIKLPESTVKVSPESTCADEPSIDKTDAVENMDTTTNTSRNELHWEFVGVTKSLLESWTDLKEVFRIPKKERVEQMKEHEREADKGMKESSVSIGYERESRKHRSKGERRVHVIDSSQHIHTYHRSSNRDRSLSHPNLSKEQRRLIFAAKVAREEQEDKQRKAQDHMVNLHQERCAALGLDASTTPIVDPSGSYYLDPKTISWIEIKLDDPNLPPELIPLVQASLYPPPEVFEMLTPEPEFVFPPWPDGLPPPPPLPPATLPPRWKMAIDDEGRCYYYDVKTRHTQWYPPSPESSEGYGSLSNSSSDSEEIEDEEAPVEENTLSVAQIHFQTKRSKLNERAEKRKKAGLVQERIISPRLEDERPSISQKSIRARKQALLEEKLKKLQEAEGIALVQAAEGGLDTECMSPERVASTKEKHSSRSHGSAAKRRRKESSSRHLMQSKSKSSSKIRTKSHTSVSQNLDLSEMLVPESEFETPEAASKSGKEDSGTPTVDSIIDIPTDTPAKDTIPGFMTDEERAAMAAANASSAASSKKPDRPKVGEKERKRHHAGHKKEREKDSSSSDKRSKEANKESFRNQIANVIVTHLNPYRKPDCKHGRIVSTDDFKHLARKMTHAILLKELKHTRDAKSLEVNDSVRHKTKEYVKKFMARFPNSSYIRSPEDTQGK